MMSEIVATMMNETQDLTSDEKVARESIANEVPTVDRTNDEILRCFVCDSKVEGRRYSLATCKTHSSRARVIEKLGELVGERYVVVINEDDVICRSCANLINTLDRLETEMKRAKAAVLRFLECKYSLAKGELLESSIPQKTGQPPRITRNDSHNGDCRSRKRSTVSRDDVGGIGKKDKKSIWMQCDKCRYTTLYDNFVVHHVRHRGSRTTQCDKCGDRFTGPKPMGHWCRDGGSGDNSMEASNGTNEPQPIQTAPLETIDLTGTVDDIDTVGNLPILTIQPDLKTITGSVKDEQIELISLTNSNTLQFQNLLPNDVSLRNGQPILMRVLQQLGVTDDINQLPLQHAIPVTGNETGMVVTATDNSAKQMLTLAEDGSLEMVAVDWGDVDTPEPDPEIGF